MLRTMDKPDMRIAQAFREIPADKPRRWRLVQLARRGGDILLRHG